MHWASERPGRNVLVAAIALATILSAAEAPVHAILGGDATSAGTALARDVATAPAERAIVRVPIGDAPKRSFMRRLPWQRLPSGFVTRRGTSLILEGRPYTFTGMNIYNANSVGNCWFSMADRTGLQRALRDIGDGQEVFRAWFFQRLATRGGQRDWRAFDRTLRLARKQGQKVIVVLADQWGACEARGRRWASFYESGYRKARDPGTTTTYRRFVAEIVRRYKDDPTILMWQLINEAESKRSNGTCAPASILRDFATDMSGLIKRIDPHHLVSLGTLGGTQCGMRGRDYRTIHAVAGIDVCEVHDYASPSHPLPPDRGHGIRRRIAECAALDKPVFIGEVGFPPPGGDIARRARWLARKFEAQFDAGVSGILMWGWRNGSHGGSARRDFDIGPGDPALRLLDRY
jgi:endo-1,4-beta-mannosidase